jgi:hypothetical protein
VYCIHKDDGTLRWRQRAAGDVRGTPSNDGSFVYITSRDRSFRIFKISNGSPAKIGTINLVDNFDIQPLIIDDILIYPQFKSLLGRHIKENLRSVGSFSGTYDVTSQLVLDPETKMIFYGTRTGELDAVAPEYVRIEVGPVADTVAPVIIHEELEPAVPEAEKEKAVDEQGTAESDQDSEKSPEESETGEQIEPRSDENILEERPVEHQGEDTKSDSATDPLLHAKALARENDLDAAAKLFADHYQPSAENLFTLNFGLFCERDSIGKLLEQFSEEDWFILPRTHDDRQCFFFCIGTFTDKDSAQKYLDDNEFAGQVETTITALRLDSFFD